MVNEQSLALDDVQERAFAASALRGGRWVDSDAAIPVQPVHLRPGRPSTVAQVQQCRISLDGSWLVRPCAPERDLKDYDLNSWMLTSWGSQGLTEKWFQPETDRSDWIELAVPGTIQSSMIAAGRLEDPFWNTNTYDELTEHGQPTTVPWHFRKTRIEQSEWWYAKTFEMSADDLDQSWSLGFDGIDYQASFYLNGHPLGSAAGMFGGPEYDVSGLLRQGSNDLVVRVFPPPTSWYGVLKGNPGWGWHYGHLISVGIWKSVNLLATAPITLAAPFVSTSGLGGQGAPATIEVQVDVISRLAAPVTRELEVAVTGPDGSLVSGQVSVMIGRGTNRFRTQVRIDSPQLWWPAGYGQQPLYTAQVSFADAGAPAASASFGIRTIEMVQHAAAAARDTYRWQFVINGVPMFIKGCNWCWTDPTNGPDHSPEPFIRAAADAGIQMLRAWGGGIVESEQFYDLCDRLGILVYQEFPYSWGPPDGPDTDLGVLDDQVRRVVLARRNHPSLIMWGGGNENEAGFGADEGLFLVGRRCRQYDPSRPYHRTDPWGGSAHNYQVYHWGQPMAAGYRSVESVFYGEFGLPSMPNRRSSERMIAAGELEHWPPTPQDHGVLAHMHMFALADFIKGLRYQRYGPISSWDDYIEYSQMAQGDALRYAAERQRAGAVDGSKTGFWFYKLTELFPGHSWGVLDFWGVRKDSYYRAKQVCRPQALFATYDEFDWRPGSRFGAEIFAGNDTVAPWPAGEVIAELYDRDLQVIRSARFEAEVPANSTARLGEISVDVPADRIPTLLSVRRGDGEDSADSWYWFNFLVGSQQTDAIEGTGVDPFAPMSDAEAAELIPAYSALDSAPLRELPRTELTVTATDDGVAIRNSGTVLAFNVQVRGRERDIDVGDSGFVVVPGATHLVEIQNGSAQEVVVTAWNASIEMVRS